MNVYHGEQSSEGRVSKKLSKGYIASFLPIFMATLYIGYSAYLLLRLHMQNARILVPMILTVITCAVSFITLGVRCCTPSESCSEEAEYKLKTCTLIDAVCAHVTGTLMFCNIPITHVLTVMSCSLSVCGFLALNVLCTVYSTIYKKHTNHESMPDNSRVENLLTQKKGLPVNVCAPGQLHDVQCKSQGEPEGKGFSGEAHSVNNNLVF